MVISQSFIFWIEKRIYGKTAREGVRYRERGLRQREGGWDRERGECGTERGECGTERGGLRQREGSVGQRVRKCGLLSVTIFKNKSCNISKNLTVMALNLIDRYTSLSSTVSWNILFFQGLVTFHHVRFKFSFDFLLWLIHFII